MIKLTGIFKKVAIVAIVAVSINIAANAQIGENPRLGVQAGLNLSNFWGKDASEYQNKPGIRLGMDGLVEFPKVKNVSLQMTILFAQQGAKAEGLDAYGNIANTETCLNSLLIQWSPRYTLNFGSGMGVFLQAGPYMGWNFLAKLKTEKDGKWESEKLKLGFDEGKMEILDMGFGIGAGLQILNDISISVGYNFGFLPIVNSSKTIKTFNSNLALTATYYFKK